MMRGFAYRWPILYSRPPGILWVSNFVVQAERFSATAGTWRVNYSRTVTYTFPLQILNIF